MGMLHSSSGKRQFEPYFEPTDFVFQRAQLIATLKREDELRASKEYQDKYNSADSLAWFRDVTREIQIKALRENGVADARLVDALTALNNARFQVKGDPEINRLTVYMREDRSRRGSLRGGHVMPDVSLVSLSGETVQLAQIAANARSNGKALAIIAGSVS